MDDRDARRVLHAHPNTSLYVEKKDYGERFVDCHWEEDKQEWGKREELHSLPLHKGGGGGGVVCLSDLELPELINLYNNDLQ